MQKGPEGHRSASLPPPPEPTDSARAGTGTGADPGTGGTTPPIPALGWILLVTIIVAFGSSWPALKYGVSEMPILIFRALTAALGAGVVLLWAGVSEGWPVLHRGERRYACLCALFNVTGWFLFTGIGLALMDAGRASIVAYTMPLWAFLAGLALGQEKLTAKRIFGLAAGILAIFLLALEDLAVIVTTPLGPLAICAAAASWGIGAALQKRHPWRTAPMALAGWQLVIGSIPLVLAAAITAEDPFRDLTHIGVLATAYVVIIGNILGFAMWIRLIAIVPAAVATLGILPVPVLGLTASALILDEQVGWIEIAALMLIVGAISTVLPMPSLATLRGNISPRRSND